MLPLQPRSADASVGSVERTEPHRRRHDRCWPSSAAVPMVNP